MKELGQPRKNLEFSRDFKAVVLSGNWFSPLMVKALESMRLQWLLGKLYDKPSVQSENSIRRKDIAHWFSRKDDGLLVVTEKDNSFNKQNEQE